MALLAGLWAGLIRIGWALPRPADLPAAHGPLMVMGFLGTLIGVERAVALGARWTYASPALAAVASLGALAGGPAPATRLGFLLAAAAFAAVCLRIVRLQPALHTRLMAAGALAWLGGALQWTAGLPLFRVAPWWAAFLVLTILGERLELSRLLRPSGARLAWFVLGVLAYGAGLLLTLGAYVWGVRLMGVGMASLGVWLGAHDLARYGLRQPGAFRFTALALMSGYVWLGIAGLLWVALAGARAGPLYDTMLHAVFLGFVFSMIFGHAPIIFPAVLGRPLPVARRFYLHLILLHGALGVRLAGDLAGMAQARRWGGLLGAAAVLLFLANTGLALRRGASGRRAST